MAYTDYSFYIDVYKPLSAMPEEEFAARAERASEMLDYFTHGRIAASGETPDPAVQRAVCAMAEASRTSGGYGMAASVSFNTDGYSESRAYGAGQSEEELLYDMARRYLQGTGLLSRIVRCRTCC